MKKSLVLGIDIGGSGVKGGIVDIKKGEYVHIHNMKALRGRGDL